MISPLARVFFAPGIDPLLCQSVEGAFDIGRRLRLGSVSGLIAETEESDEDDEDEYGWTSGRQ
jgi:hypothetical protein